MEFVGLVTLLLFSIISFSLDVNGTANTQDMLASIEQAFHISPWLFLVPVVVIFMIIKKAPPGWISTANSAGNRGSFRFQNAMACPASRSTARV